MKVLGAVLAGAVALVVGMPGPEIPLAPVPDAGLALMRQAQAARFADAIIQGRMDDLNQPDFSRIRGQVGDFYFANSYLPAWVADGQPTARALELIARLESSRSEGLNPSHYDSGRWNARLAALLPPAAPEAVADFDLDLTVAAMRYVSDLRFGRANPGVYDIGRSRAGQTDLAALLRSAVLDAPDLNDGLHQLDPRNAEYGRTLDALQRYRRMAEEQVDTGYLSPIDGVLEPGSPYADSSKLASLLVATGDLAVEQIKNLELDVYDGPLVGGVKRFQARHGLTVDGRIGKGTLAELNTPIQHRVRQLELSLERWRWLPRDYARAPILVNLPEFRLRAGEDLDDPQFTTRTVVGAARGHRTPGFSGELSYVVFRPYWNVPISIQKRELVPHLEADRGYLAQHGYEVVTWQGAVVTNGEVSDEVLAQLKSGAVGVRQVPGPENSLGAVKFMFPNQNNIYMHDTPSKALFAQDRRDFSHGCVRVENPAALAEWVLQDQPEWTPDRIRQAMNAAAPLTVPLKQPIPVLLVYYTAQVLEDGETRFFPDIYGYDRDLDQQLAE